MDVDEHERTAFYQHMGHSADMNRESVPMSTGSERCHKNWEVFQHTGLRLG